MIIDMSADIPKFKGFQIKEGERMPYEAVQPIERKAAFVNRAIIIAETYVMQENGQPIMMITLVKGDEVAKQMRFKAWTPAHDYTLACNHIHLAMVGGRGLNDEVSHEI